MCGKDYPICPGTVHKQPQYKLGLALICLAQLLPLSSRESRVPICPYFGAADTHHATRGPVPECESNLGRCPGESPAAAAAAAAAARAAAASLTIAPSGTLGEAHGDQNRVPCSGPGCRRQEKLPLFSRTTAPRSPGDELYSLVATASTLGALGVETQIAEFSPPRPHCFGEGAGRRAGSSAAHSGLLGLGESRAKAAAWLPFPAPRVLKLLLKLAAIPGDNGTPVCSMGERANPLQEKKTAGWICKGLVAGRGVKRAAGRIQARDASGMQNTGDT